jgi:stage II sporulation protein D
MIHSMVHRRTLLVIAVLVCGLVSAPPAGATSLFTLVGRGWGHGIGMSQYGALGFAQKGYTWDQIIRHYYTGVTIDTLPSGVKQRVLLVAGQRTIGVSFASAATAVDESTGEKHTLPAGIYRVEQGSRAGMLRLYSQAKRGYIWQGIGTSLMISPGAAPLRLDARALNGYTNDHWWGSFRVIRNGNSLDLVNHVGMEGYVRGVVPCEVPASWLPEAVRTQAVAARSYAIATRKAGGEYDAYPDTRSQVYCPIEQQAAASDDAVRATARKVVKYQGQFATTFFSSSSGGRTSSLQASWGSPNLPYLVPVADPFDAANGQNPNHEWAPKLFTPEALTAKLHVSGTIRTIDHTIDDPSQRVLSVVLHRTNGDVQLSAGSVFSSLGLRSTWFRLLQVALAAPERVPAASDFTIKGRLWPKPLGAWHLEQRIGTGSWVDIGTPALDSTGLFELGRRSNKTMAWRIVRPHAFSPVERTEVFPNMTIETPVAGGFSGTMSPPLAGAQVLLIRSTGSGWETRATATVGSDGSYQFNVPPTPGTWRVHFDGDAEHGQGNSPPLTIASAPSRMVA